jgi:hypothetical protein
MRRLPAAREERTDSVAPDLIVREADRGKRAVLERRPEARIRQRVRLKAAHTPFRGSAPALALNVAAAQAQKRKRRIRSNGVVERLERSLAEDVVVGQELMEWERPIAEKRAIEARLIIRVSITER